MAHPRHRHNIQQRVYPRLNTALRHRFPQGSGWLNKNTGSVWLFRQQGGEFRQPLWMSRPGGGGNQVTVHMRLVDTNIRIVPAAQTHFRGAGGIGAAGAALQNTGGGQQLCPEALINDGLLHLRIFTGEELIPALFSTLANPENSPNIVDGVSSWFEITAPHEMTFNLDGEPLSGKTFRMELLPAALRCRLPPDCPLLR